MDYIVKKLKTINHTRLKMCIINEKLVYTILAIEN